MASGIIKRNYAFPRVFPSRAPVTGQGAEKKIRRSAHLCRNIALSPALTMHSGGFALDMNLPKKSRIERANSGNTYARK
jgi:hypothetical protein